ncbi:hypothetical protein EXIGLDRAFT_763230 [Exidia glandulosa HHB12029]|uniref:Uncharacterized protein n=1 Tax=Exidia glandulosa HHB12029 TaxID=1314781 RepID=A0A166B808_EXIGL|nr:hypothetical protein EXIGLDRAFT_763230 [Exidia glandulosa HHB12029]
MAESSSRAAVRDVASGPKKVPKPVLMLREPRKPKDQFRGTNGFDEPAPSSLDPLQVVQFALDNLGSPFPSADTLRATGRQGKTLQTVKARIQTVKKQQEEELARAYEFRNTENLDLVDQQRLGILLDVHPSPTIIASKMQSDDEAELTDLANMRRMQEHATDDLVSRVRHGHIQTLAALRREQLQLEKHESKRSVSFSNPTPSNKFPQTPEEFAALTDLSFKLRVARFLKSSPSNQDAHNNWTDEDVNPLMRTLRYDVKFRTLVEKLLNDVKASDPRQRGRG